MRKSILAFAVCVASVAALAGGSVVKIEGTEGAWRLTRNGKPYFIYGGGGGGSKALLKEIGGNSFRTWGAGKAKAELDEAAKYGHTVMLGFWLGHHNHGFSYLNKDALAKTEREVLETVAQIKDHPALLCYALGNEMELGEPNPKEMWTFINDLAKKVKAADPNHPVGTVVADMWKDKADAIIKYAPELQYMGLNSYGGALTVGKRWRELGGKIPYILTEYGPMGAGECGKAPNGLPLEWTSTRKAEWYRDVYQKTILDEKDKWCLGGYVFTWGHKNEVSPTWFGEVLGQEGLEPLPRDRGGEGLEGRARRGRDDRGVRLGQGPRGRQAQVAVDPHRRGVVLRRGGAWARDAAGLGRGDRRRAGDEQGEGEASGRRQLPPLRVLLRREGQRGVRELAARREGPEAEEGAQARASSVSRVPRRRAGRLVCLRLHGQHRRDEGGRLLRGESAFRRDVHEGVVFRQRQLGGNLLARATSRAARTSPRRRRSSSGRAARRAARR